MTRKPGRNDPCPCKSGKKFKRCCDRKPPVRLPERLAPKRKSARRALAPALMAHAWGGSVWRGSGKAGGKKGGRRLPRTPATSLAGDAS